MKNLQAHLIRFVFGLLGSSHAGWWYMLDWIFWRCPSMQSVALEFVCYALCIWVEIFKLLRLCLAILAEMDLKLIRWLKLIR